MSMNSQELQCKKKCLFKCTHNGDTVVGKNAYIIWCQNVDK